VTPGVCAAVSLLQAACATATLEERGRGSDEDGGLEAKPELPDARPPVGRPDAGVPGDGGEDAGAPDAGCAAETISLLGNGDFDEGADVAWEESSSGGFALIVANGSPVLPPEFDVTADSPEFMSYLGGYNNGLDVIHQEVAVPADAIGLRLRGAFRIETLETIDSPFDHTFLEITSTEGEVREQLADFSNDDDTGARYINFDIDVAGDFAGQTVRFRLRGTSDEDLLTHFFFDTLLLEASACTTEADPAR